MTLHSGISAKTILVIDDDQPLRSAMVELLGFAGYRVAEASSARQGLTTLDTHTFDLIMVDLMMPDMDGYSLLAEVRRRPDTAHVPVIIVTGKADPADQEESLRRGATGYLVKPFRLDEVLAAIEKAIKKNG